jgi:prepilin-type N-terminal cleavage/methylation domain-containing protein/prepilin-type processing-associated H-X9-DG protein
MKKRDAGFTLVEILVVIGIIGLLIAILLPALNRARSAATTLQCLTNMRAIAQAAMVYANDNKGRIPRDQHGQGYFFASQILRQINQPEIPGNRVRDDVFVHERYKPIKLYKCPAANAPQYHLHYTVNSIDFDRYRRTGEYGSTTPITITRFPRVASVAYVMEANVPSTVLKFNGYGTWDVANADKLTFLPTGAINPTPRMIHAKDKRHLGKTNLAFLDGHGETRRLEPKELPTRLFNPYAK